MKNYGYILLILSGMLSFSCNRMETEETTAEQTVETEVAAPYSYKVRSDMKIRVPSRAEKGIVIVRFEEEPSDPEAVLGALPGIGATSVTRLFPECGRFEARTRAAGLHLWYCVSFDEKINLLTAAESIAAVQGVETLEFAPRTRAMSLPFNDPYLAGQWHYENTTTPAADVNVYEAWNYETGNENVIVGVLDEGVMYNHVDLADAMWVNEAELNGTALVDDDGNGYVDDIYGYNFCTSNGETMLGIIRAGDHGTHVSGTIAAVNNNGLLGCGLAGGDGTNRGARIMCCQIMQDKYGSFSGRALKYAADNGAVITNNSWGYDEDVKEMPSSLAAAIDYFNTYAGIDENGVQTGPMAGGLCVFAAGNEASNLSYPAAYDGAFSVSSIGPDMSMAYYSNYGSWVDIAAPGGNMKTSKGGVFSTLSTSTSAYGELQGTSMACPHVAGVAALVVSRFGRTGFTRENLIDILEGSSNAKDLYAKNASMKSGSRLGKGLVDAGAAMLYAAQKYDTSTPPDPVTDLKGTLPYANQIALTWTVPSEPDCTRPATYQLYRSKSSLSNLSSLPSDAVVETIPGGSTPVGNTMTRTLELDFETTYHFRIVAFDFLGNASTASSEITVTTGANTPPTVTATDGTELTLHYHESGTLQFAISDADNHTMTAKLASTPTGVSLKQTDNTVTVSVEGPTLGSGTYALTLQVSDSYDTTEVPLTITVQENHAPEVSAALDNQLFVKKGSVVEVDLSNYFTDEDGETPTYTVASSSKSIIVKTELSGSTLTMTSNWYGMTDITVTAADMKGDTAEQTFKVLVRDSSIGTFDLYPNPVAETLYIRAIEDMTGTLTILNSYGSALLSEEISFGPFNPAAVDVTSFPRGKYMALIDVNGTVEKFEFVKL